MSTTCTSTPRRDNNTEINSKKISDNSARICLCQKNNCLNLTNLGTIYPGQSIQLKLRATLYTTALYVDGIQRNDRVTKCNTVVHSTMALRSKSQVNLVYTNCTTLSYTIRSKSSKWCMLHLRMATREATLYSYNITLKKCPLGLILNDDLCICDPTLLNAIRGLSCDVQTGIFERPPNSWIATDSKNSSDIIYIDQCHYDYCSLVPMKVDIQNSSNAQCLSRRSGIACGKCSEEFSAVFGTSACKKCSNTGIFLIPVFAVLGLLLILFLFLFNITVTNGKLYGFIFFINCVSMYSFKIFPGRGITYIITMLLNLDLGIEVCFYDGMTMYTATWLRFLFPAYLLLIIMGLAMASRYSAKIEKLTRRRIIPVSATLYLLTLNKLIMITSQVIFSYSVVYHFHSKKSEVYWSMDTDIQLFGVKYILLFTFCLLIFIFVLMPITICLLFPSYCYKISIISKTFRPFIDAYQAPFKDNCRYFLGVEFLIRIIANHGFCCIDSKLIPALQLVLLLSHLTFTGYCQPFKSKLNYAIYSSNILFLSLLATLFLYYYYSFPFPTTYIVIFNTIIYLSLLEFWGIIIFCIIRTIINSNDKVHIRCQSLWVRITQKYLRLFKKPLKLDSQQSDEDDSLIREELIGYIYMMLQTDQHCNFIYCILHVPCICFLCNEYFYTCQ